MEEDLVVIRAEDGTVTECSSAIVIPERALIETGYVRALTTKSTAHSKHEFHAMAQIARSLFQDDELEIEAVTGPLTVQWKGETQTVASGVVVLRDAQGELRLIGNSGENAKELLRSADRFCTRWIRLDI